MVRVYVGSKFGKQREVTGREKEKALKRVKRKITPSFLVVNQQQQQSSKTLFVHT